MQPVIIFILYLFFTSFFNEQQKKKNSGTAHYNVLNDSLKKIMDVSWNHQCQSRNIF